MGDEPHRYEPLDWQKGLGYRVDPNRCAASVHDSFGAGFAQCSKKKKGGSDWCGVHSPEAVERRKQQSDERYKKQREEADRKYARPAEYRDALRQIADGHNDPRSLAAEILKKWGD